MDPTTAFGVAAAVVQFISFASDLISKTGEIYTSANGASEEVQDLDTIYSALGGLAVELEDARDRTARSNRVSAVKALARKCAEDCQQLMSLVGKLKAKGTRKSKWASFRAALMTVWKSSDIAGLERRISRAQQALTLEICAITSDSQALHLKEMDSLREERTRLGLDQTQKLVQIEQALQDLSSRIQRLSQSPAEALTPDSMTCLADCFSRLSTAEASARLDHKVLRILSYKSHPVRHSSIPEHHEATFKWVFDPSRAAGGQGTTAFADWLGRGKGIFWISGKPGSGKSTLMKYVADSPLTHDHLRRWAHPYKPVIGSHYFWSLGTTLQRSQEGLYRSLLYDILRQIPSLIERFYGLAGKYDHRRWKLPDLRNALERLSSSLEPSMKLCVFIDGLDEYDGDHFDLCEDLVKLSRSPQIKLCVVSRPWNVFEDAFGSDPSLKMYIHTLTRSDIYDYAESRLSGHPRWPHLEAHVADASSLFRNITRRASGVFLWVFLVVRQLMTRISNADSFSDLERSLEGFPNELETFFKQMLDSVEDFYHQKMAGTLRVAVVAAEPLDVLFYYFLDKEFDDANYALTSAIAPLSVGILSDLRDQVRRQVNGRTKGLLELNSSNNIEFLHRTVRDYLRTHEMTRYLVDKSPKNFCPEMSIFRAHVADMKATEYYPDSERRLMVKFKITGSDEAKIFQCKGLHRHVRSALFYASAVEGSLHPLPRARNMLVDHLEKCIPKVLASKWIRDKPIMEKRDIQRTFRREVISAELTEFVSWKLSKDAAYFASLSKPAAAIALDRLPRHPKQRRMLQVVLGHAEERWDDSPWSKLLDSLLRGLTETKKRHRVKALLILEEGIIPLLLGNGANANVLVRYRRRHGVQGGSESESDDSSSLSSDDGTHASSDDDAEAEEDDGVDGSPGRRGPPAWMALLLARKDVAMLEAEYHRDYLEALDAFIQHGAAADTWSPDTSGLELCSKLPDGSSSGRHFLLEVEKRMMRLYAKDGAIQGALFDRARQRYTASETEDMAFYCARHNLEGLPQPLQPAKRRALVDEAQSAPGKRRAKRIKRRG